MAIQLVRGFSPAQAGRIIDGMLRKRGAQGNPLGRPAVASLIRQGTIAASFRSEQSTEVDRLSQAAVGRKAEIVNLPKLVRIEAGTFPVEGSKLFGAGQPTAQAITISGFMAGKYPVTVAEFREYVGATGYVVTGDKAEEQKALLADRSGDRHPMVYLTQAEKLAYAAWLSEQTGQLWLLLSAAQQEYIRRGVEGRTYPWGNEWLQPPHFNQQKTVPVDAWPQGVTSEGVSGLGIVWEATRSWFGDYEPRTIDNPEGPSSGKHIEVRGGSAWISHRESFYGASRSDLSPGLRYGSVGFRLGRALTKDSPAPAIPMGLECGVGPSLLAPRRG